MRHQELSEALVNTRRLLQGAERSLDIFTDPNAEGSSRTIALWNFISALVQVRNALEHARSIDADFESFFRPHREEMRNDELWKYFVDLRNKLDHHAAPLLATGMVTHNLDLDLSKYGPKPTPNAHFFIGDRMGGSGWAIPQPDGSEEKIYVNLPPGAVTVTFSLPPGNRPKIHRGRDVTGLGLTALALLAYRFAEAKVKEAGVWLQRVLVTEAGAAQATKPSANLRLLKGGKPQSGPGE